MQIPFNSSLSLHHGPSSVSFGFGCGSTFGGNNSAMLESPAGTSSAAARASPIDVHAGAARASAKRTRDGSDEEDQDTSHTGLSADLSASLDAGVEAMDLAAHASPESKRRRAAVPPATSPSAGATDEASRRAPVAHGEHRRGARTSRTHMPPRDVDLGKLLASLDKPALLSLLHRLATDDAALSQRIYTLMPSPSLEGVSAVLDASEARMRAVLPAQATAREPYVWLRVRSALAELAGEVLSLLPLFSVAQASGDAAPREPPHPATAFAFLITVTQRMLAVARLLPSDVSGVTSAAAPSERSRRHDQVAALDALFLSLLPPRLAARDSPDALSSRVFPALFREWEHWLRAVDTAVNRDGRMYGQEVVLSWQRALAALGTGRSTPDDMAANPRDAAVRTVMDQIGARMTHALGWLTGPAACRPASSLLSDAPVPPALAMDEAEEEL